MTTKDIKTILIIVEFQDGSAHQVLSTKENKKIILDLLATMDNGLKLSDKVEPFTIELCQNQTTPTH